MVPVETMSDDEYYSDSTDGGVEEESGPISLQYKKSKLFEKPNTEPQLKQNTPGKLKSWQPLSSKSTESVIEKAKPAPKKLNINWTARTQERAAERAENEQPLKFTDMGDVKTKFETGQVGKKEFKSEGASDIAHVSHGKAQSTKDSFENRAERQYDSTKRRELEELKIARTLAAQRTVEKEDEVDVTDARVEEENSRYRELEEFKKAAGAKQNLSKFESGSVSNIERSEKESRKEVESILGSGKAANTLKLYESGEYEKKEYESPVKQELGTIKANTSSKKNMYESGQVVGKEYESEAKKELETIAAATGETRNKFESGELLTQRSQNEERVGELEEIRSVSAAGDKKNKFESGELIKTDFDSHARQEIQEMKTGASEVKSKYESGELIRTQFDSDAKKEVQEMSTGAMDKKSKYESGEVETREYDSVARKEAEEVKRLASSSSIKSKYKEAVDEGNKVVTSKPVTIEKAPPGEDPFINRSEDEDFKVTYVPSVQPKKMTNIEERFKKEEVEKPAPAVNKIQMPTFDKPANEDDDVNGEVPDEEEVAKLKELMWPKNTTSIKSVFEAKEQVADEPKEAPKPIDLEAEISDYDEGKAESLQGAYEEEQAETS